MERKKNIMCSVVCGLWGIGEKWEGKVELGWRGSGKDGGVGGEDDGVGGVDVVGCGVGFGSGWGCGDVYENEERGGGGGEGRIDW